MEIFLRSIFLFAGHVVAFLGGGLALLLVGMFPLYIAAYFFFVKKVALRSSILFYAFSTATAVVMSTVIAVCAVALGMWG
jgi:hypothetical protein